MYKNIIASSVLHIGIILIATMSLPFITKKPLELPPIISVELIQIMDKTNIPYAPKAKKIIEDVKKKEEEKHLDSELPPYGFDNLICFGVPVAGLVLLRH